MINMRKLIFTTACLSVIILFTSCTMVKFQTQNIKQPILLNTKIGIPSVDIPETAKPVKEIEESVFDIVSSSSYSSTRREKSDANTDFISILGTKTNRFFIISNFKVSAMYSGTFSEARIKYKGTCYELPNKN